MNLLALKNNLKFFGGIFMVILFFLLRKIFYPLHSLLDMKIIDYPLTVLLFFVLFGGIYVIVREIVKAIKEKEPMP